MSNSTPLRPMIRTKPLPPPPSTKPPLLPKPVYQGTLTNTALSHHNINGTLQSHDTRKESHDLNYGRLTKTKPLPPLPGTPPPLLSQPICQRNTAQSTASNISTMNGTRLLSHDSKTESFDPNSKLPVMKPIKPHIANTRSKFKQLPDQLLTPTLQTSSGRNILACYHGHNSRTFPRSGPGVQISVYLNTRTNTCTLTHTHAPTHSLTFSHTHSPSPQGGA